MYEWAIFVFLRVWYPIIITSGMVVEVIEPRDPLSVVGDEWKSIDMYWSLSRFIAQLPNSENMLMLHRMGNLKYRF